MYLLRFQDHLQAAHDGYACQGTMISSVLKVPDEKGLIESLFAAESQGLLNDRGSYSVSHSDGFSQITVEAKDATALRAVLNSVCKILIVFEKTSGVIDER